MMRYLPPATAWRLGLMLVVITACSQQSGVTEAGLSNIGVSGAELAQITQSGDTNRLAELLDAHPELLQWQDENGRTLLHHAAWRAQLPAMRLLIERGADVNALDNEGDAPIHMLQDAGAGMEAFQLLWRAGAY